MESQPDQPPLIVIVGETASGKSALALELAQQFNGEIIAADSRTVYKGVDIGTAKPSKADQALVRHHLIDIADVDKSITAADFKRLAQAAIVDITARGKIPFLVGGTGLYVDAIIYDFTFRPSQVNPIERKRLEQLSVEQLQAELQSRGIPLPANDKNPRHLIRQLETNGAQTVNSQLRTNMLVLGSQIDPEVLKQRIATRTALMMQQGLESEVRRLTNQYGWEWPSLRTIGYQEFRPYFEWRTDVEETKVAIERNTYQYARRQRTWFKRNKSIHWVTTKEESVDLVTTFLNK